MLPSNRIIWNTYFFNTNNEDKKLTYCRSEKFEFKNNLQNREKKRKKF